MRIKVSDYIADFLVNYGINTVFTVVGGGAMHLNDSFGHHKKLHCIYQHHEQACSIAAEGYARINQCPAAVCVTSGPGGINALNGVIGAYQDSIPMIVFSGQTKRELSQRYNRVPVRTLGNQEFDIISALDKAVKYCEMVDDPLKIRQCLEKAYQISMEGRKGPCWLDLPLDVQSAYIETDELVEYKPSEQVKKTNNDNEEIVSRIIELIKQSKRPVFYAGNGIRYAGAAEKLLEIIEKLHIPVVTCWNSIDLIPSDNPFFAGRGGIMGDRSGNYAVQNSDLLISIGSRLNVYQTGYNIRTWAREAYRVMVDIDEEELKKPTLSIDFPVRMDAGVFLNLLLHAFSGDIPEEHKKWVKQCKTWREKYPVVQAEQRNQKEPVNVYAFMDVISRQAGDGSITVVSNGSASVVGSQAYHIGKEQRFLMNCALSSMGYGLPASIGAALACCKDVICIEGDGSLQMNIQELATVVANNIPIKLFVINNKGYHQIRQTQKNVFNNELVGIGPESGDLFFPSLEIIAKAYGLPYVKIDNNRKLRKTINEVLIEQGAYICEVICDTKQPFQPKSATKRLEDGSLYSPPLEDMAPFLSREELKNNMFIKLDDEA